MAWDTGSEVLTLSEETIPVEVVFSNPAGDLEKHEKSPRHRLMIIVHPRGEARVSICISVPVYVGLRREVLWVAADIFLPLGLIHAYVINPHMHRERQMFKVNETEAFGQSQVDDNILQLAFNDHTTLPLHADGTHHRFLRNRPGRNLHQWIRSHASC